MARKKQKVPQVDPSPVPPTDAEWDRMIPFKKFIITEPASDEENVEHLFEVGDCVSVLPPNLPNGYGVEDGPAPPLSLMWLGIIKDIRTGQTDQPIEELDAWARVQWFYNKKDLSSVLPKL
ncbi:hypothetical protein GYMLUDRAFT_581642 [Collybiopsis luxurians FD-317 M1]|uniref:BAH domain-containing protein n=1 Tax=Collybiopsis luxurians FD-317 M1 TaxID=944289 RepID=A0A0D0BCD7_9AGAR|nr:hypothetical protein GYMLUDRAFT_581642 [Collybiopsis luxurians FD-317 M1]